MYSTMKSAGRVVVEPLLVLERVVHLGEGHRAGLEPAVEHLGDAAHRRAAGRVVGVGARQVVDGRAVQVGGAHAEVALDLVERAVDVGARVGRGRRSRQTGMGEPQNRLRQIDQSRAPVEPLAERAVAHVVGDPVDLLVERERAGR